MTAEIDTVFITKKILANMSTDLTRTSPKIIANYTILCSRHFELHKVVDILEQEGAQKVLATSTSPPDVNVDSDEDSVEENGGGFIDNLSWQQLRAPAKAILGNVRLDGDKAAENSVHNLPQTSQTNSKRQKSSSKIKDKA